MPEMKNCVFNFLLALCFSLKCQANVDPFRILSIDGGGVRGIIPATILEKIESDLNKPIAEIFDMVTGTSIGGIIALILASPNENGLPAAVEDVLKIAFTENSRLFKASFSHWVATLGGLFGPKYESGGMAQVFNEKFGDLKLSQTLIPALVTAYSVENEQGIEFFSEDAKMHPLDKDCLVREVAMATTAAPTFFNIVDVHFPWGTLRSVADGALYKNDPAILAYATARKLHPKRKIEVYSLGTGRAIAEEISAEQKGSGITHWMGPISSHLIKGAHDADQTVLHKLLNADDEEDYFRLNVFIDHKHRHLDDTRGKNLVYLYQKGLEATMTPMYQRMIERLRTN
jgi:patatin-like phospholipase/acyl hydrolase